MFALRYSHLLVATGLLCAGGSTPAPQLPLDRAPGLILFGAKVFTADSTHPWAEALAIRGDRVSAVGTSAQMRALAGRPTRLLDLGGRVVVPGFNDAHDHVGAGERGVSFATGPSPMPDPTPRQVLDSLRAVARRTPKGTWLRTDIGMRVLEDSTVRRPALDSIAPEHPVLLLAFTGHGAVLNTAALRALGIPEDVPDPLGGMYERDVSGHLTGVVTEYAGWSALRQLYSQVPDSTLVAALRRHAADGLRYGITSVQDMHGYLGPATTVRVLRAARLPIRLRVVPFFMTDARGRRTAEWESVDRHPSPLVVVSGAKWILDGTPIERLALLRAPYADRPGWRGRLNFPEDTVRAILREALAGREQLMLHVVGDSTARLVFALMERLAPDSAWRQRRVRIEHGDGITADLMRVAHRLGIVVVQNPTHFALNPDLIRQRFGRVPADFQAARSLLAGGVPLALGSDGPRNPFLNIMLATMRPTNPDEALTREQAVTAYTRGSAYAEFAEREKGVLAPGMLADLAVLSQDIFTVAPQELPRTTSVLTVVGGRVAYDAGILGPNAR